MHRTFVRSAMHRRVVAAAAARTRTTSSSSSSSPLAASVVARRWTPGRPAQRATLATRASATSEAPALNASGETNKALAWKAAIDFKFVRDNAELVQKNATTRKVDVDVQEIIAKYEALNALNFKCDELRERRNANAKSMKGKMDKEVRDGLIAEGKAIKDELAALEGDLAGLESELQTMAQRLPNLTHPDVPIGSEENTVTRATVGEQRAFTFPVQNHVDVGEKLGMFDFETGSKVSGSRFVYLTGVGAMLELALINWAFAKVLSKGFKPMMVPDMVRSSVVEKCGFQPRAENTQVYSIENSDLCMAGTAGIFFGGG
uniref:Serine-tRNA synthetase type1 N-terminal domain-containing protein n=1 Tax=Ostreococcus sp. 'lucimarinus' TaxID=242159 RepID=A0A7R9XRN9_9CHLO